MKLLFVVLYEGQNKLLAVADAFGKRRTVQIVWKTAEVVNVPPENWFEQVKGECDYQRSEENSGRHLF